MCILHAEKSLLFLENILRGVFILFIDTRYASSNVVCRQTEFALKNFVWKVDKTECILRIHNRNSFPKKSTHEVFAETRVKDDESGAVLSQWRSV